MIFYGKVLAPFFFVVFLFLFFPHFSEAATCVWTGTGGDGLVSTAGNWSSCPSGTPQPTDSVMINATANAISWNSSASSTVSAITLDTGYTGTLTFNRSALTVTNALTINTATGSIASSNALTVGSFSMSGGVMAVGSGTFVISGAGAVTGGSLTSGSSGVLGPRGNFTVSGGAIVAAGALQTAGTGSIGGAGTFTASSLTVSAGTSGNATTTLAGNLTVSGDCTINNVNSTWAVLKLGSSTLSCGGAFSVSTAGPATTYGSFFYGESGTLTVTGLASVLNYGIVASSTSAFYGDAATLNFNGGLTVSASPSLSSTPHNAIFHAGTSGTMTVTGGLNIYNSQSFGAFGQTIFDGGGKTINISGALFADSLGTDAIIINAGTSGTMTVSGTSTIFKVEGTGNTASTTFNGQSKNLVFTNGVTVWKASGANGEVLYTPSTGANTYSFTLNKAGGALSFATTSTITGNLTNTAGTLVISSGTTTVTGNISNSDTIRQSGGVLKKAATSVSFNASSYAVGDTITVTLIDQDQNLVGTSTETTAGVTATLSSGSDSEAMTLTETGNATYTFTGSLLTSSTAGSQNDGTLYIPVSGTITLAYTDPEDSSDNAASATATITAETTAPVISSVSASPETTTAVITWTTNENSSSMVDYGLTNSYGNSTVETDTSTRVLSHSQTLSGLSVCNTYHYRVRSKDLALNEGASGDGTFATSGCAGGVPILFGTNTSLSLPGQLPSPQTVPAATVTNTPPLLPLLSGPFVFGERSQKTKTLQEYLSKDKTIYPEGKITGYYGPLTKKAVSRFQEKYNLAKKSDSFYGLAGPKTRAKIMEVLAVQPDSPQGGQTQTKEALILELNKKIEELKKQIDILLHP